MPNIKRFAGLAGIASTEWPAGHQRSAPPVNDDVGRSRAGFLAQIGEPFRVFTSDAYFQLGVDAKFRRGYSVPVTLAIRRSETIAISSPPS
jgi:hypothetical protein